MNIELLPDEYRITESNDKTVCLTSQRLYFEQKDNVRCQIIRLEEISSIDIIRQSSTWYILVVIILAIVILFIGRYSVAEASLIAGVAVLFSVVRYLLDKRVFIEVKTPFSSIRIDVSRMGKDNILNFIKVIEDARYNRVRNLNN
jgi:TRAP-type uncharacterized transport system fused permease subunit